MIREFLENSWKAWVVIFVIVALFCSFFFIAPIFETSCDKYVNGASHEYPTFPDEALKTSVTEYTVVNRCATSTSRSSTVKYNVDLVNAEGDTKTVSVSLDEFVSADIGVNFYTYSYMRRPYTTYSERMTEWVNNSWIILLCVCIVPLIFAIWAIVFTFLDVWDYHRDYYKGMYNDVEEDY